MRHIKSLLQTWLVVIFGLCELILIGRFAIDFLGVNKEEALVKTFCDFSESILGPFKDTFTVSEASGSVFDLSCVLALVVIAGVWYISASIIKILFDTELSQKGLKLVNLLFGTIEGLFIFKLVLSLLGANSSKFVSIISSITGVLVTPISSLFSGSDFGIAIASVISMIIIGLIWFTVYKLIIGATESIEGIQSKKTAEKAIREKQPQFRVATTSVEAASTMYEEEVVSTEPPKEESASTETSSDFLVNDPNFVDLEQPSSEQQNTSAQGIEQQDPSIANDGQPQQSQGSPSAHQAQPRAPFEQEKKPSDVMPKSPLG